MKVNSREEAWELVNRLFPTNYEKDDIGSENAGYPVYKSTSSNEEYRFAQIADLNCRLEVNDGIQTMNIWIEEIEEKETKTMAATVRSMTGEFEEYKIQNIVSIQYIAGNLMLVCMEDDTVATRIYNSNTVIVEIH